MRVLGRGFWLRGGGEEAYPKTIVALALAIISPNNISHVARRYNWRVLGWRVLGMNSERR